MNKATTAENILAGIPLSFEENRGQAAPDVLYLARGPMYGVSLRRDRVTLTVPDGSQVADRSVGLEAGRANVDHPMTSVSLRLTGSRPPVSIEGLDSQKARSHYYRGPDPSRWITDVPHVARVRYESVYPGIDLLFYGSQRRLEFDFVVGPQARVSDVGFEVEGVEAVRLEKSGDLVMQVTGGELTQHRPIAYQERDGARRQVEARYILEGTHVRLDIGTYDHSVPLVIDPVVDNIMFVGGSGVDSVTAMALDQFGQLHVAGYTQSPNFPMNGGSSIGPRGSSDVFLMRFSPTKELLTTTIIGGPDRDEVNALAVDATGAAYLVGTTYASGYPTTPGAFDETFNGGPDVFATKVALGGQLVYSTYIGGGLEDQGRGAALIEGTNELLIVGETKSTDFPRTMGPGLQGGFDVFLLRLNASGSSAGFASRLVGGSADDDAGGVAVRDAAHGGTLVIGGGTRSTDFPMVGSGYDQTVNGNADAFVAELTPAFVLQATTFYGGNLDDKARGVAVFESDTFVTGSSGGGDCCSIPSGFAIRLGPSLQALVYSRNLGSSGNQIAVANDPHGINANAYIVGDGGCKTPNAYIEWPNGIYHAFVAKLNAAGTLMYCTSYGAQDAGNYYGRALAVQGTTLWMGGYRGTSNSDQTPATGFIGRFTHFDDTNVTQQLLSGLPRGPGTINSSPPGFDLCYSGFLFDCYQAYPTGTVVTLTDTENVVWTGCDTSTPRTCVLTMSTPRNVVATWAGGNPVPSLTGFTPATGTALGGTPVVLTGSNFFDGTKVTIGGVDVSHLYIELYRLSFLAPPHAAGIVPLVVTTQFGTVSGTFTYVEPSPETLANAGRPVFSFDGRWMAFDSTSALVEADTNGLPDVYVRDRSTNKVVRVSLSSTGAQAIGGGSQRPSISATGRFVAFESAATNLVPGDTNGNIDIFVRDRDPDDNGIFDEAAPGRSPITFRVNVGPPSFDEPGGVQALGGDSQGASISGNGRWIAFDSWAMNLILNDTNRRRDVFVYDTLQGRTLGVSVDTYGGQGYGDSSAAAISLDGHAIAFQANGGGTTGVFVRDRDPDRNGVFDELFRLNTSQIDVGANGSSSAPSITADGQFVAFLSEASNLVAGDTNGVADVFLRDRFANTTRRMSLDPTTGRQFAGASGAPAISANGNTLIFSIASTATIPSSQGVTVASVAEGTDTGGTVTIPGPNQGNGPDAGKVDPNQDGETSGAPGVSGDGSTTGTPKESPGGGSQIEIDDGAGQGQGVVSVPPPFIADLSPASGPPEGGGSVEIIGGNFGSNASVQWGPRPLPVTVDDSAHAHVNVPLGTAGPVPVQVTLQSNGQVSNAFPYIYRTDVSTPRITSIDPKAGPTTGGTLVTITGTGFMPDHISLRFRGRVVEIVSATATTLTMKAPENLEGTATIVVINVDGGEAVADDAFVYTAPPPMTPIITGVFPAQGFRETTTVVTLRGQPRSFAPGTTATIDGRSAPVSYYSDSTIVVEVPPGARTGIVPLVVTVPGAPSSAQTAFYYAPVPNPFGATQDTDGDGMPDVFEQAFGFNLNDPSDATADPDADGRTNVQEYRAGQHPVGLYKRYLAEGAANEFFETRILIANPNTSPATVLVHFQRDATPPNDVSYFAVVPPLARIRLDPAEPPINLPAGSFATVVESNLEVVVDRTMYWDHSHYGSSAETSLASPSTTWYLAEGATNPLFELFYLLQNPDLTRTATVRIRYIRSLGNPIEKTYAVPPQSRQTIRVNGEDPSLAFADISAVVTSENGVPIIVERAMYARFANQRPFEAGHDSAGVTTLSKDWFLAEGATGPFFEEFILYSNPGNIDATVDTTYLMPDGTTITKTRVIPANRRVTVQVASEDPKLVSATASARITSTNDVPIIVERTMWWPAGGPWIEAHNSPGSTSTGTRWAVADGEIGGPPFNTQTFLLIANTSSTQGRVRVTLLFDDGSSPVSHEVTVLPHSRQTIPIGSEFPESVGHGFGALIESLLDQPSGVVAQIVAERAMYSDTPEHFWGAGTNVLATKLK